MLALFFPLVDICIPSLGISTYFYLLMFQISVQYLAQYVVIMCLGW